MRLGLFLRMLVAFGCAALLGFALMPGTALLDLAKMLAVAVVLSVAVAAIYPGIRGVRAGDTVSVVSDAALPALMGRMGRAASAGRKNGMIKVSFNNGNEVTGILECDCGMISPPKVRVVYEEKQV